MISQTCSPTFENISQRVVFSHQRQMPEISPVRLESLSPGKQNERRASQRELDAFFRALYQSIYDHPEAYGLPTTDDVCVEQGASKERKQDVRKKVKKARDKLEFGVEYLYHLGRQGTHTQGQLRLERKEYDSFFAKSPRVKQKLVKGMQAVGLTLAEQEDAVRVGSTQYPNMMPALQALAQACAQRDDEKLALWLFARCDLRALDTAYQPDVREMLRAALSPPEYEHAMRVHRWLAERAYDSSIEIGGVHNWRIRYQGNRAIKATPLVEFEYDERELHQLHLRFKCVATNRLVPLLSQQPAFLQEDFFRHAHSCGAPKCSWCKTRKGLNPSVLKRDGEKRTICWWMQRHFVEFDNQAVELVVQYAQLHEDLLAA